MKTVQLGRSGLKVSPLWLGSMMFGHRTDEAEAGRIMAHAREHGVNAVDTADVYAGGKSEEIVGRLVKGDRARWIVATKCGVQTGEDPNSGGASRRWITLAAEASLKRLGTDWIDVLYLHRDDVATPLEETVLAMADLIRAGKIRYFALSNFAAWRIAKLCELCRSLGIPRPVAIQPPYSAVTRGIEVEVVPCAADYGLGLVVYSPLARGVLTGKYSGGAVEDSRAGASDKRMMESEFRPESIAIAEKIRARAEASGRSVTAFALRWALSNPYVSGVIGGPRTLDQWQEYVEALATAYSSEDDAFVDALVPPGHSSTHGYTDPAYPVMGR